MQAWNDLSSCKKEAIDMIWYYRPGLFETLIFKVQNWSQIADIEFFVNSRRKLGML